MIRATPGIDLAFCTIVPRKEAGTVKEHAFVVSSDLDSHGLWRCQLRDNGYCSDAWEMDGRNGDPLFPLRFYNEET